MAEQSISFSPSTFIGQGWVILGNRRPVSEGWGPSKLDGVSPLMTGEHYLSCDNTRKRMSRHPLLGTEAFWCCWTNQHDLPIRLRPARILFIGDDLRDRNGRWHSLYIGWSGILSGWYCGSYDGGCYTDYLVATDTTQPG